MHERRPIGRLFLSVSSASGPQPSSCPKMASILSLCVIRIEVKTRSTDMVEKIVLDHAACYAAMRAHDARFDGRFFCGVSSTGIYCRPICRVKLPREENCTFFPSAAAAEAAGYRPCL